MFTCTLRLSSTAALVFRTYKLLKVSSAPAKTRTRATTVRQRRKNARELLVCWVVWICFLWIEYYLDFYVSWAVPLYSQIKFFAMAFLVVTRSHSARPLFNTYLEPIFISNYVGESLEILEGLLIILGKYLCKAVSTVDSYLRPSTWKMFSSKSNGFWTKTENSFLAETNNNIDKVSKHPHLSSLNNKNSIIKNVPPKSTQDPVVTPVYRQNPTSNPSLPINNAKLPGHFDFSFSTPSHLHLYSQQQQQQQHMSTPVATNNHSNLRKSIAQNQQARFLTTPILPQEEDPLSTRRYSESSEPRTSYRSRPRHAVLSRTTTDNRDHIIITDENPPKQGILVDEKSLSSSSSNIIMVSDEEDDESSPVNIDDVSMITDTTTAATSDPVRMIAGVVIEPSPVFSARRRSSHLLQSQLRRVSSSSESPSSSIKKRQHQLKEDIITHTASLHKPLADASNNLISTEPSNITKPLTINNGGTRPLRLRTISKWTDPGAESEPPPSLENGENRRLSSKRKRMQNEEFTSGIPTQQGRSDTTSTTTAPSRPTRRRKIDSIPAETEIGIPLDIPPAHTSSNNDVTTSTTRRRTRNGFLNNEDEQINGLPSMPSTVTRTTRRSASSSFSTAASKSQSRHFLAPPVPSKQTSQAESQNNVNESSIGPIRSHTTTSRSLRKPIAQPSLGQSTESSRNKRTSTRPKRQTSQVPTVMQTRSSSSVRSK